MEAVVALSGRDLHSIDVRLIAERRYGELLKKLAKTTPQEANLNGRAGKEPPATVAGGSAYRAAIERDGISERSAERYQALATVPQTVTA